MCAEPGLRQRPDMSNTKINLPRVTWGWQQDSCITQALGKSSHLQSFGKKKKKTLFLFHSRVMETLPS